MSVLQAGSLVGRGCVQKDKWQGELEGDSGELTEELFFASVLGKTVAGCWKPLGPSYRIIKCLASHDLVTYLCKMLESTILRQQRFMKCLLCAGGMPEAAWWGLESSGCQCEVWKARGGSMRKVYRYGFL